MNGNGINNNSVVFFLALGAALFVGLLVSIIGPFVTAILFLGGVFGLVSLLDFRIGVVLLIATMPFASTKFFPHQMFGITGANPLNALILATMFALALNYKKLGFKLNQVVPRELVIFLVFPCLVGVIFGAQHVNEIPLFMFAADKLNFDSVPGYIRDIFVRPMLWIVFGFLVSYAVIKSKNPERLFIPVSLASISLAMVIVFFIIKSGMGLGAMSSDNARGLLSFTGVHANELGLLFSTSYALHLFSLVGPQVVYQRLIVAVGTLCCGLIVALSFSRAAILSGIFITIYFMISRRKFTALFWGVMLLPVCLFFVPDAFVDRLMTGISGGGNSAALTAGRLDLIWMPLIKTIPDHLFFGNGLNSVLWSYPLINGQMLPVGHAHSAYLNTILDFGVVGCVLIAFYYRYLFLELGRMMVRDENPYFKNFYLGLKVALIVLFLQGITDDRFTPSRGQVFVWVGLGFLFGRRALLNNSMLAMPVEFTPKFKGLVTCSPVRNTNSGACS